MSNPIVFLEISIQNTVVGRILLELYAEAVPKTCGSLN